MVGRTFALLVWVAGCGFQSSSQNAGDDAHQTPPDTSAPDAPIGPPIDAPIDTPIDTPIGPPIDALTCSDLQCGANATCDSASATPVCRCNAGYALSSDNTNCVDVNECLANNGGCAAACQNTAGSFVCYAPKSCAELTAHGVSPTEGTYTLYLTGDATKPWNAYCADMNTTTPHEYLTLTGTNTGQYAQGGQATGMDVTTTYMKIRFDPATLIVDISDKSFAMSQGSLNHPNGVGQQPTKVTSMPYAVAMDCRASNSATGTASIDLGGTKFAIADAQRFVTGGNGATHGDVSPNNPGQRATITGGGNCGWNGPAGLPSNPFNNNVNATNGKLQLTYQP